MTFWWIIVAALGITSVLMIRRDARRLRCAIFLGLTVQLAFLLGTSSWLEWIGRQDQRVAVYGLLAAFGLALVAVLVMALLSIQSGIVLLRKEGIGLAHSLTLLLGLALIGYLAAVIVTVLQSQVTLLVILLAVALPFSYLAWVLVCFLVYQRLYRRLALGKIKDSHAVVVLGAGIRGTKVTPLLGRRLDLAIKSYTQLISRGEDPYFVVSGGQGSGEQISEAEAMAAYVAARPGGAQIPIIEENRSTTTQENLRFTAKLLPAPQSYPWLVVTSDFHAFRAANLLFRLGIEGNAIGARNPGYFWGAAILREYAALLRDNLKLNVVTLVLTCVPLFVSLVMMLTRGMFN